MTATLTVRGLCLTRGARAILQGVNLDARTGEIVALMGLSGSGKTTILRVIAGLETPDSGERNPAWMRCSTSSSEGTSTCARMRACSTRVVARSSQTS